VGGLAVGATTFCTVPRLGLADGTYDLWITGFRLTIADAGRSLGSAPATVGVVPVATTRSLRFRLAGGAAELVPSDPIDPSAAPVQVETAPQARPPAPDGERASGAPFAGAAAGVVVLVGGLALIAHRRRRLAGSVDKVRTS